MFSWIPIHREAIHRILEYRAKQNDLLKVLREMEQQGLKVISLQDKDAEGKTIPLAEIDPFTFLATFNRGVTDKNRRENWIFLKTKWSLDAAIPNDFEGIPTLLALASWLFPYAGIREKDHIARLWDISTLAAEGGIEKLDETIFNQYLKLKYVGIASLSIGLFWINPEMYLPADHKTRAFGKSKGVTIEPEDYQSYRQWLGEMTEHLGHNYPQLSYDAHLFAKQNQLVLSSDQMQLLWKRFHEQIQDFKDFQNPGSNFVESETNYKRALAKKFDQELGAEKLSKLVEEGNGLIASKEIIRIFSKTNLVDFRSWNPTLGETDQAACDVIREFLKATAGPYQGPESTGALFEVYARHDLQPAWDAITALLWVLRPDEFFPVKIRYFRKLSEELGHNLPKGKPDANKLQSIIEFGAAFWKALEPQKPSDWVDVQSFIWCVCPGRKEEVRQIGSGINGPGPVDKPDENQPKHYWWLNANPRIWNIQDWELGQKQTYTSHNEKGNKRRIFGYFQEVEPGDLVVGYVTSPQKEVVAICKITKGIHVTEEGEVIEIEKVEEIENPISYEILQSNPALAESEPIINNQGSLFKLTEQEFEIIRSLIDEDNPKIEEPQPEFYSIKMAMDELFLTERSFKEMLIGLEEKKNVVLLGAPGVGKTFIAERLAFAFIGSKDPQRVKMIQFHQSYSYEDFIQGFRPTANGQFAMKYGMFYQFCRRAQRDEAKGKRYILIIDEINRGNLSRIFGELMMLIEPDKRGKKFAIPLAYGEDIDDEFYIPENLYILGLMNTADRSLAMVDYALRRRFRFIRLNPEFDSDAFSAFLNKKGAKPELVRKIISRMKDLNKEIEDDKNLGIGFQIGHSYFCPSTSLVPDEEWYRRVVEKEIGPLLEEYWIDNLEKAKKLQKILLA